MKMKNKKNEQIARKKQHKQALILAKKRQHEPSLILEEPTRLERQNILIVCEGVNTEPSYFRQFRLTSGRIVALGAGCETIRVVDRAIEEKNKGSFDQIWVVFDKDDFSAQDFNAAIEKATQHNFGVAYSNQSFEYWLILHFEDHQGGSMHRDQYHDKINEHLTNFGLYYDGNGSKKVTKKVFDLLLSKDNQTGVSRIQLAINRARRIFNLYDHRSPAQEESSTSVFLLVEEILKFK
ncbi:MAG: RloB domain-containing protein [Saprospiraceae bacterium]|nr:RloB domain-containing protein [Saprospiraceae bacterium]